MKLVETKEVNLLFDIKVITENTSGEITDDIVFIDSQINNNTDIAYTLPPANLCEGKSIRVICKGAESHCVVDMVSGDSIVGTSEYPPFIMSTVGDFGVFISDGLSKWYMNEFRIL